MTGENCLFCRIVSGEVTAVVVYEDKNTLAFLDHRPLFPGHTLLVPREHYETLTDLPEEEVGPFFENAQLLARAVEAAIGTTNKGAGPPARATDDETATLYNTKCKMCHGATAEKKFDATKADDVLIQTTLDGKTAEKPPNMPAFKDKLSAEEITEMVRFVRKNFQGKWLKGVAHTIFWTRFAMNEARAGGYEYQCGGQSRGAHGIALGLGVFGTERHESQRVNVSLH